jgi:hypothetical protein
LNRARSFQFHLPEIGIVRLLLSQISPQTDPSLIERCRDTALLARENTLSSARAASFLVLLSMTLEAIEPDAEQRLP